MDSNDRLKMLVTVGFDRVDKKNKRTRRRANDQMIDEAASDIGQPTGNMRYGDGCTGTDYFYRRGIQTMAGGRPWRSECR